MHTDNPSPHPSRKGLLVSVTIVVVVIAAACVVGTLLAGVDGLVAAATIATALGTLALAWQTFALAKATRKAVEGSGDELNELKAQRGLLKKQAKGIAAQAEATARLAEASSLGAQAAARARIDSVSPLVHTTAQMTNFLVFEKHGTTWVSRPVATADQWFEPQLKDARFEVTIAFTLKNVGKAPANLSFGDTSTFLEDVTAKKLTGVVIEPGAEWKDTYIAKIHGPEGTSQTEVRMPFTYEGILYAEMFDRIQWNGLITPLQLNDGIAKRSERVLNHSGAQVFRTYPSLEEPERIASQAQVIQNGQNI
jgi:hypothetical protein